MQAVRAGWRRLSRDERLAYLILLPALSAVFVIVTIPFVLVIIQSLSTEDGTFVGPLNYSRALANPLLYEAIRATGVYALIVLPIEILLGLSFALLVHRTVRRPGLRAAIYVLAILPLVVPPVAIGVVARLIYAPGYGVLNVLLERYVGVHQEINWLGDPTLAMLAVASVDIWQWTPFVYLVLFSGLQTVPRESVEAAQIDGANWWAQFRYIDLHYLRPLFILILFFRLADVLRVFDHVFILTGGGPGTSTQLLSLYMYRVEFKFFDTGQAAALAVVVLVSFSLLYTLIARVLPLERA
ncbi:MAG: sugar ABC transporter permease [Chloroflexi bacterium]|nr:MAG: sugar ABC transporter permease [Chloroflexota bacterium]TMF37595.1 MAG: sugar ABC transporter permease [Chloroflexota bacterium]